jgi:hypothetical protein
MNKVLHRAIAAIFAVPAVTFGATVTLNGGTVNQCSIRKSVTLPNGDVRIDCAESAQASTFLVNPPCLVDNKVVAGKPVIRVSCDVEEDIRRYTLVVGNVDGTLRAYQQSRLGRPDGIYSLTDAATQGGYYTYFSIWEGEGPSARQLIAPISLPLNSTATGCYLRPHLNRHPDFSQFAANMVAITAECAPSGANRIAALEVRQVGANTAQTLTPVQFEGTAGSATAASFLLDKFPSGSYEVKLLNGSNQPVSNAYPITVEPFDYNNVLTGPGGLATLFGTPGNSCFFKDNQLQSGDRAAFLCGTAPAPTAAPTPAPTVAPTPAATVAPTPAPTTTPAPTPPGSTAQCQINPASESVLARTPSTFSAICSPRLATGTAISWKLADPSGAEVSNASSGSSFTTPSTLSAGIYTVIYNYGSAQATARLTVSGSSSTPAPTPSVAPTPAPTRSATPSCKLVVPATSQAGLTNFTASCDTVNAVEPANPQYQITSTTNATITRTIAASIVAPYGVLLPADVVDGPYTVKFIANNTATPLVLDTASVTVAPTPSPPPRGVCTGTNGDGAYQEYFDRGEGFGFDTYLNSAGFYAFVLNITPTKPFSAVLVSFASPPLNQAPNVDVWVESCPQQGGPVGTFDCRGDLNSGLALTLSGLGGTCKVELNQRYYINIKSVNKVPVNTQIRTKLDYKG